ncbi:disease resistance protein SUMM2-like [Dioscorea cayenensis subsp. rotundata]|uniref:Disease resistance protein SUMM2-like n=1 Tax=Dioscorea cayennensis subsp. rotundata TaxID=55577 RepID=A0AB40AX23_DIOCR|nr:disease resistance protein SUMM2-like [Dioscorea cayenensis subsp. rotundata]
MTDIVNTLLGALCTCMQNPAVQEKLRCIITSTSKLLDDVKNELEDLKAMENGILNIQEEANRTGKQLTPPVQRWLDKAHLGEKYNMMIQLKDDYNNRGCLVGSCSLNCWAKYKISQRSIKLLKEIKNLKTEYDAFKEKTEAQPPRAVREIPTSSIVVGKIIKLNLEKVHGYLADDNVSMVGIWGMGGVGKTTLLNEINNSLLGGDTNLGFKYVIPLVVSKEPQFEKLQKEISIRLGLQPPHSEKNDIFEFLKKEDFLILLDDMWKAVDLPETLGIPLPHHQSQSWEDRGQRCNHKVIFTTREDDVCARMKADRKIKVECLDGEEAWHLFKQHANEETINSNASIKKIALKVMEKCLGLPLALKVIGGAMSNKKKPEEWRDMLRSLVNLDIKTVTGMQESLFNTLKLSYDNLVDDTLQQCFLCCAQWPEDEEIDLFKLIEYWVGIGLIDDFRNIGEAFDKGYNLIGNLNAACLVELHYSSREEYVKLHDVIRDMALWIVSECGKKKNKWITCTNDGDDFSQSIEWEEGTWKETERIFFEMDWESDTILLLNNLNIDAPTSPRYPNLKSLFINASLNSFVTYDAVSSYNSFLNIFVYTPSLIYLNLFGAPISDLSKEIRVLVNLRYLNISNTFIWSLPPEFKELRELKYFICRNRPSIKDGLSILSRLPKLQVIDLYKNNCLEADDLSLLKTRVKAIGMHVTSVETLGLFKHLPTWNLSMHGLRHMPKLRFCDLSNKHGGEGLMQLIIEDCDFEELLINGSGVSLKHLELSFLKKLKQITWPAETLPSECFPRLTSLYIGDCDSLRSLSWVLHLPCLRTLNLECCSAMEELIDPADQMQQASSSLLTFPSLLSLQLSGMLNLVSLSTCPLDFPVLSRLDLHGCPKLKKLPFKSSIVNNKFKMVDIEEDLWESLEWEVTTIQSHLAKFL